MHGEDGGSYLAANASEINVRFPVIMSDTGGAGSSPSHGHGLGLDIGGAWQSGPLTAGLALQNLRLDLLKLKSSGLGTAMSDVTNATQEARALSREIGHAVDAAKEVRRL